MKYGRYKIVKEIGRGRMGIVYQAHDSEIDLLVALKVLKANKVIFDKCSVQRFIRNAKIISRLSHPNIVKVYDVGEDNGTTYIVMEFLEGKPLFDIMEEDRPNLDEVVNIGIQLALALDYAHQKGIVHGNITHTNIYMTSKKRIKLTGFGSFILTPWGEILGNHSYLSPEQIKGETVDSRSDLYFIGSLLYGITVGKKPFEAKSLSGLLMAILQVEAVPPKDVNPSISKKLSDLIMKSINKDPDDRFKTGKDMAEALKKCLTEEEPQHNRTLAYSAYIMGIILILISVVWGSYLLFH